MQVVTYETQGSFDNIQIQNWPDPEPGEDEVVVKIMASALNGFDPMILLATTGLKTPLPMVPCGDGAGVVHSVGRSVKNFCPGDRVSILPYGEFGMMGETAQGTAREYVTLSADNLIPMPEGISFVDAAALPVAYGTAWRMVYERGRIQPGEKVLVLGASGGVGVCCIQLAKSIGAETIACVRGEDKAEAMKRIGADHVVNTADTDFVDHIRNEFGRPRVHGEGGGVDVVVNYIGGETWVQSLKVLKRQGRMLTCGATAGYDPRTDIRYIWSFEHTIIGSDGWTPADQRKLMDLVAEGRLKPVIHAIRPFSEARQALVELHDRRVIGKSILVPEGHLPAERAVR